MRSGAREISTWLAATVAGQAAELQELGFDAILVIDEPGIAAAGLRPTEVAVWDPLRAAVQTWGLHICGAVPWDLVGAAAPDLVSFDVARYGVTPSARRALSRLISRGGRVMWGVSDPAAPQPVEAAMRQIASAVASLSHGCSTAGVAAASLVSGCCGTGFASIDDERSLAASIRDAAALVGARVTSRRAVFRSPRAGCVRRATRC